MRAGLVVTCICIGVLSGCAVHTEHYVRLKSSAPALAGAETSVYVREIPAAASSSIPKGDRVVLFVHGGAFAGSTVFDLPHSDYSWMRYFANAGYDTFAVEFTGYGRSLRPPAMNDPCNLVDAQQKQFIPVLIPALCPPSHPRPITTMESEWDEMDAVIEHIRKLRGVDKVAVVGWSRAGPRTSGYVLRHPDKISRVFILAPDYGRTWSSNTPRSIAPMQVGTQKGLEESWASQTKCEGQSDPAVREIVWKESIAPDPVGAGWGTGVRRQLPPLLYGINQELAKGVRVPFAMASGPFDTIVSPATVKAFYEDLGSSEKLFIDLGCASHFAMWEKPRMLLFKASLEWIRDGKVNGMSRGETKLGY